MRNKTLFFWIIIAISPIIYAQSDFLPGHYISIHNDTVRGLIGSRMDSKIYRICEFKHNKNDEHVELSPSEIKSYQFKNGRLFVSKTITDDTLRQERFLAYLVSGKVDLYYFRDKTGKGRYYINRGNDSLSELRIGKDIKNDLEQLVPKRNYIAVLKSAMSDYPEIYPSIEKCQFSHRSLIKLISSYNSSSSVGNESIVYSNPSPKNMVEIGAYLGTGFPSLFMVDPYHTGDIVSGRNYAPLIGLLIDMPVPTKKTRISISFETILLRNSHIVLVDSEKSGVSAYFEYYLNAYYLQNIVFVKIGYPMGKIRPSIGFGPTTYMMVGNKSYVVKETVQPPIIRIDIVEKLTLPHGMFGYSMFFGVDFLYFKNMVLYTGLRYQKYTGSNPVLVEYNYFSFDVGFKF
jgi:hypothetical protein